MSDSGANFPLYIHDAFALNQYADLLSNHTDFVVLDHHSCEWDNVFFRIS